MSDNRVQLFILPYAGGSIAAFKRLTNMIDGSVDVITVEYAGRGTRAREPLASSFWELLDDAIAYCRKRRDKDLPYALMGYSMGSVLAYEMLARNAIQGELIHLFLAAEVSPKDRSLELSQADDPTDEQILERARSLGGLDENLLKNPRFSDIYIRPMLSDYRLFFGYRFGNFIRNSQTVMDQAAALRPACQPERRISAHDEKIKVDTTLFYCEKDTAYKDVVKWEELIEGRFDFHELGEDHFFLNQHYREMAIQINKALCAEVIK